MEASRPAILKASRPAILDTSRPAILEASRPVILDAHARTVEDGIIDAKLSYNVKGFRGERFLYVTCNVRYAD